MNKYPTLVPVALTNPADYPEDFVKAILHDDLGLMVKRAAGESLDIVVNLAETSSIHNAFPEVHSYFEKLSTKDVQYIFISIDMPSAREVIT